jgi:hypothetical protein
LTRAFCLSAAKDRKTGSVLIATIALLAALCGKDYCDYDFQTERFFLKSFISQDRFACNGFASSY